MEELRQCIRMKNNTQKNNQSVSPDSFEIICPENTDLPPPSSDDQSPVRGRETLNMSAPAPNSRLGRLTGVDNGLVILAWPH